MAPAMSFTMLGQVADLAVFIDDAGLFAAGRAVADELHNVVSLERLFWMR